MAFLLFSRIQFSLLDFMLFILPITELRERYSLPLVKESGRTLEINMLKHRTGKPSSLAESTFNKLM